jgi:transcriptional regulator GlxA family with amidase domain
MTANLQPRLIAIVGFEGAQLLDIAGPLQVFASACDLVLRSSKTIEHSLVAPYEIVLVSPKGGLVRTSSGASLQTQSMQSLQRRSQDVDTLIVAGGPIATVREVCRDEKLIRWISGMNERARRVCSVCTGAFVLAQAGVLVGRRAVTHWTSCNDLASSNPDTEVESNSIFVHDGPVWTSAGVTTGIDLALALVEEDLGLSVALSVARWLVVFLKRPGGQSQFSTPLEAQIATAECSVAERFSGLHAWISENLGNDLTVEQMAKRVGMSPRTFARTYRAVTGTTPAKAIEAMRVEAARRALESDQPVKYVASTCGFGDYERLRRAFYRRLKVTPRHYQAGFRTTAKPSGAPSNKRGVRAR